MPRTCTIWNHPSREEIDAALVTGKSFRNIAKRFGTSTAALFRHMKADLPATLVKSAQIAEIVEADTLVERLKSLHRETMEILREARTKGTKDSALALKTIVRAEKQLELEGRLLGELGGTSPRLAPKRMRSCKSSSTPPSWQRTATSM